MLKEREGQAQAAPEGGQEEPEEEEDEEDEDFADEDEEEAEEEDEDRGDQAEEAQPEEEEQEHAAPDPARSRGTPRPKRARTAAPRQPRQPRSPRCPAYAAEPAHGAKVRRVWSITITPTKPACRLIAPNDQEKLQCCQENTVLLGQLFAELMLYDAVCVYHFGLERGHINENPHNQGAVTTDSARSVEHCAQWLDQSIRAKLGYTRGKRRVDSVSLHIKVDPIGTQTEEYQYGYTWKDEREPWFAECGAGYDDAFKKRCKEYYENHASDRQTHANAKKRRNPRNNDNAGRPHLITKTNFVDGAESFGLRMHKEDDPWKSLVAFFDPSTVCLVMWWLQSGRAILAPSWVATYGRGDADEIKLELLREITMHPASARDITNVRYLLMNVWQAPTRSVASLLYRPRILGASHEHERLSLNEAMHVLNTGEYPLFITLARRFPVLARPRGHIAVLSLTTKPADVAATIETLSIELYSMGFNMHAHVYHETDSFDKLGVVATGLVGLVQQDCATIPLADVDVSMMTRFLNESVRFRAVDVLERAGISLDDDGRQSIPVLLPAQGADLSATVPEPILPDAVSARFAQFEKETQQLNETGYAALRKTYACIVAVPPPPAADEPANAGTAYENLGPLDVDDEGNPMPAGNAPTKPTGAGHHFVVLVRFGPHAITSRVLRRENLTPFAQGRGPPPERDIPTGWHAHAQQRWPWHAQPPTAAQHDSVPYPPYDDGDDEAYF